MRVCKYAIDDDVFDTIKEARAFKADPANGYDPEYTIETLLYEVDDNGKASTTPSVAFSDCGTDWEESRWMQWYSRGIYKGIIGYDDEGYPIYAEEDEEEAVS